MFFSSENHHQETAVYLLSTRNSSRSTVSPSTIDAECYRPGENKPPFLASLLHAEQKMPFSAAAESPITRGLLYPLFNVKSMHGAHWVTTRFKMPGISLRLQTVWDQRMIIPRQFRSDISPAAKNIVFIIHMTGSYTV